MNTQTARVTPPSPTASAADPHVQLGIYVRDHRAGAEAGLSLARRILDQNRDNELTSTLENITQQIDEDRHELDALMHRLGHEPPRLKMTLAVAGEWLGRLKLNGRLRGYSPVSRVEEFEMLTAGIVTKASLWRTLRIVLDGERHAAGTDFNLLIERAEEQVLMLEQHRGQIVREAFHPRQPDDSTDSRVR